MTNAEAINPVRIGRLLREWRLRCGITQRELGERAGIVRPLISRYERGHHLPQLETLDRLLTVLGIAIGDLFRDEETR